MTEALWLLLLIAAAAAAAYYAGWRASAAYLNAAQSVSAIANETIRAANEHQNTNEKVTAALDSVAASVASLHDTHSKEAAASHAKLEDVEIALRSLFEGFERAGLVRSSRPAPGRQVGESATDT